MITSSALLLTKYGYTINTNPHASGTGRDCFRPYMKKPAPMALKMTPSNSDEVSTAAFYGERLPLGGRRVPGFPACLHAI